MGAAVAFLRRDALNWMSYRFGVATQLVGVLLLAVVVWFIGGAVGRNSVGATGQDYVAFVLAGIAFTDVFTTGLTALSRAIRESQLAGTLEPLLVTPLRTSQLVLGENLFPYLQSALRMAVFVGVAVFGLGYWHDPNVVGIVVIFVPAILTFSALGLISGAMILTFKQGDPILLAYAAFSGIVGGALFPVAALPAWLRPAALLLPLTYALHGLRLALDGAPLSAIGLDVLILWAFSVASLPVGAVVLGRALLRAKKEGSLGYY